MCQCNPNIRTPFCGRGDCAPPKPSDAFDLQTKEGQPLPKYLMECKANFGRSKEPYPLCGTCKTPIVQHAVYGTVCGCTNGRLELGKEVQVCDACLLPIEPLGGLVCTCPKATERLLPRFKLACNALIRKREVYSEDVETMHDVLKVLEKLAYAPENKFKLVLIDAKYDNVLVPFAQMMATELHANSQKGDQPGWLQMSPTDCLFEIHYHMAKLTYAVKKGDAKETVEFAADVGNMCMMLLDICKLLTKE